MLATDDGRARFWAESAIETDGHIHFVFPNGYEWNGAVLERRPPTLFGLSYIGGSTTTFTLAESEDGGTDLELTDEGVQTEYAHEVLAGWVSALMALKAAVDHSVDLRNHDPQRTWDQGFADN
jgi:hypothetical protein